MNALLKLCLAVFAILLFAGCWGDSTKKDSTFHTSGSKEADQRAEQRIAKEQQIRGKGSDADGKNAHSTLYSRLGGDQGIAAIVNDFVDRSMADPRVNFVRKDVTRGGVLGVGAESATWNGDVDHVKTLKLHMTQFIALATGGPTKYEGREMKSVHEGMKISNDEFNACIGDMKQSLDGQHVPVEEQKELLSILESARPQIVEQR